MVLPCFTSLPRSASVLDLVFLGRHQWDLAVNWMFVIMVVGSIFSSRNSLLERSGDSSAGFGGWILVCGRLVVPRWLVVGSSVVRNASPAPPVTQFMVGFTLCACVRLSASPICACSPPWLLFYGLGGCRSDDFGHIALSFGDVAPIYTRANGLAQDLWRIYPYDVWASFTFVILVVVLGLWSLWLCCSLVGFAVHGSHFHAVWSVMYLLP